MHKTTLVIAESPPRFSEVWMTRMSQMLMPSVKAAYLHGTLRGNLSHESEYEQVVLAPKFANHLPRRIALFAASRSIKRSLLKQIKQIEQRGENVQILCHYLTNAVYLRSLWGAIDTEVFVHCHGHDVTWERRIECFPWLRAHPRDYLEQVKSLAHRCTFIANSQATWDKLLLADIPQDRIRLKYLGVEVGCKEPFLSKNPNELTILFLGRLTDFKGPVETIRAFNMACERGLNAKLLIAGGGHQLDACVKAKKDSRFGARIELLGPVSPTKARELIGQADIFTAHNQTSPITGQEEAFGVSIIEAMASGVPVVTGRSGGVCETVVNGETGILFEPGSIENHAAALVRLANDADLRHSMGIAGHHRVRKTFSIEQERTTLLQILGRDR